MLNKITQIITFGRKKEFQEIPSIILVLLGAPSFLIAAYFGLMFSEVIPELIHSTNDGGFTKNIISIWLLLGIYSLATWWFGCTAVRCHKLLFERWFK